MRQIFVDMDGVLADFDRHHEEVFGVRPDRILDNVNWKKVREYGDFYLNIPPMKDMRELWNFVDPFGPVILTGIPSSVSEAAENKRAWVRKHFGSTQPVITCLSKEKYRYCQPGAILIDDWEKYRNRWQEAGGIWVTHTSAADTIRQLKDLVMEGVPE